MRTGRNCIDLNGAVETLIIGTTGTLLKILSFRVIYIIQKLRNYWVGKGKLVTPHTLLGNYYDLIYISFSSNCEEFNFQKLLLQDNAF